MKKFFWILILFVLMCPIQEQDVSKFNIDKLQIETQTDISFHDQVPLWYELTTTQKISLILEMMDSGDGNLKYQVEDTFDVDSTETLVAQEIVKIKSCMDNNGYAYYMSYESDLEIGVLLLECMNQFHMFRD